MTTDLSFTDHVVRVEVQPDRIVIELSNAKRRPTRKHRQRIEVPWRKTPPTRRREILLPASSTSQVNRPIRSENRALLVASIARGRRWLDELVNDPDSQCRKHCRARRLQRPQGQHDDLARLPRARSRQGGHRRDVSRTAWVSPGSATCPPNGPASTRCSAFPRRSVRRIRTSLRTRGLRFPGNGDFGPETARPEN